MMPTALTRGLAWQTVTAEVDISTAAALASHSSVVTTARYDRRDEAAKKRAARALHVPYYGGDGE